MASTASSAKKRKSKQSTIGSDDVQLAYFSGTLDTITEVACCIVSKNILFITRDYFCMKKCAGKGSQCVMKTFASDCDSNKYSVNDKLVDHEVKLRYTSKIDTENLTTNLGRSLKKHEDESTSGLVSIGICVTGSETTIKDLASDKSCSIYLQVGGMPPIFLTPIKTSASSIEVPMTGKPYCLYNAINLLEVRKGSTCAQKTESDKTPLSIKNNGRFQTFVVMKDSLPSYDTKCVLSPVKDRLFVSYRMPSVDVTKHIVASKSKGLSTKRSESSRDNDSSTKTTRSICHQPVAPESGDEPKKRKRSEGAFPEVVSKKQKRASVSQQPWDQPKVHPVIIKTPSGVFGVTDRTPGVSETEEAARVSSEYKKLENKTKKEEAEEPALSESSSEEEDEDSD